MTWDYEKAGQWLDKLVTPGVIGTYHSFEVTELFKVPERRDEARTPLNILTVIVADPRGAEPVVEPLLNPKPLALKGTDWKFGVARYRVAISHLQSVLSTYSQSRTWQPGPCVIEMGRLEPLPPQFVAADGWNANPWNAVLKNNFWNGSHVLELFDGKKSRLGHLVHEPARQSALTALIRPFVPWGLDALSDCLGNVIIQLPVTILVTDVRGSPQGEYVVRSAWQSSSNARKVRVTAEIHRDDALAAFDSRLVTHDTISMAMHARQGGARHTLWDEQEHVLLGASPETAFLNSFSISSSSLGPDDTRTFERPGPQGEGLVESVPVRRQGTPHIIGDTTPDPRDAWRARRALRQTLSKLERTKEFVQYGGPSGAGRDQGLNDLRELIQRHGQIGAWLWDPYLTGVDLLDTVFFNPHFGSDLRGLTACDEPPQCKECAKNREGEIGGASEILEIANADTTSAEGGKSSLRTKRQLFHAKQVTDLEAGKGNTRGLKLEYRSQEDNGWSFHDRFLIFPQLQRPALAWSLGTSVNSFGRQHHILQKVVDGELISRAFLELWGRLNMPKNLIWKSP